MGSSQFAVVALFHNLYSWICAVRERLIIAFMLNPLDPLQLHLLGGGLCACPTMTPMTIRRLSNYMLPTIPQYCGATKRLVERRPAVLRG